MVVIATLHNASLGQTIMSHMGMCVLIESARPYELFENIQGPAPPIRPFRAGTSLLQNIST